MRRLGFQDRQLVECHMVLAVNASDGKEEDLIKDTTNDYPTKDTKLKGAPPELEDGSKKLLMS